MGKASRRKTERERVLKLVTNEPTQFKKEYLRVIIQGMEFDEIGYMDGRDPNTGEIVPLLVAFEPSEAEGQFNIYPLARLYMGADMTAFEVPDGRGNYISQPADGTAGEEEARTAEGLN